MSNAVFIVDNQRPVGGLGARTPLAVSVFHEVSVTLLQFTRIKAKGNRHERGTGEKRRRIEKE